MSKVEGSERIEILSPFPTFHFAPISITLHPSSKLLQAQEGLVPSPAFKKDPYRKYLLLKTLWKSECSLCNSLQHCFPNMAKLKALRSLNPRPSSFSIYIIFSILSRLVSFHYYSNPAKIPSSSCEFHLTMSSVV